MLLLLSDLLAQYLSFFQVFQYLTLRGILGVITAFFLALLLGPRFISHLQQKQLKQTVRHDGPESHFTKTGTPTMGGTLILWSILLSTLLWGDLCNRFVLFTLFVLLGFGVVGFIDDYLKVIKKSCDGLSARAKYLGQSIIGGLVVAGLYLTAEAPAETQLFIPFVKTFAWEMPWYVYALFSYIVIVGASNAVNLTDGLDGLAILPTVLVGSALGIIAYLVGHVEFADYLNIGHVPGVGELVIFCAAIGGAGLGFLWFNTYPAQVFMGDVGSLALGGALGVIAVITRHEIVFFIMAGVFVLETVSVILQVTSFKLTGNRIFRMAPIHHHFELKGWPEPRVIVRFWIITV